jgi:hypothetical protein
MCLSGTISAAEIVADTVPDLQPDERKEIPMKSVSIRTKDPTRKTPVSQQQPTGPSAQKLHALPPSPCEDLHVLISKRACELYGEQGYRHGAALDDWLEAEREILSQIPPV